LRLFLATSNPCRSAGAAGDLARFMLVTDTKPKPMDSLTPRAPSEGSGFELRLMLRQSKRVLGLIPLGHKLGLASAALMMAMASACSTAVPLLIGMLVDGVRNAPEHAHQGAGFVRIAGRYLSLIACALLIREATNVARRYLIEKNCSRIERTMTLRLVTHLLRVNLRTLANYKLGALDNRISRSIEGVIRFLRLAFLDFFPALVTGFFALSAAIWKQPMLGAAMAGVIPISLVLTIRQLISQKGIRLSLMRLSEDIDGMVVEQLGGLEYIRAAHTENVEAKRLDNAVTQRGAVEVRHYFEMSLYGCAKALNEGVFHIVVLACAAYFALRGSISFGDILSLSMLFGSVMAPLAEVHRVIDEGHESSLRIKDLLQMLDEPVDASFDVRAHRHPHLEVGHPAIVVSNITVDHVSPRGQRIRALDHVSFEVRHGETIGIAGRSGSGKSTCMKVLLNLIHPNAGRVFIGDVPIGEVTRAELARLIGYVGQEPFVFAGTVEENIAYGPTETSADQIRRVATMANIHDEILHMPRGYQAQVTERGHNLSGGQCQRIALARTLLHDPRILIFDEATSALDNIGERYVQHALEAKRNDRTLILVAHRLSTLRHADRIIVFDSGHITEMGTFRGLVDSGGVFADLVRSARE
jgi:ATP-binding cassette subfamily B protein